MMMLLIQNMKFEPLKWAGWKRRLLNISGERTVSRKSSKELLISETRLRFKIHEKFILQIFLKSRLPLSTRHLTRSYECEIDMENYFSLHAFMIYNISDVCCVA